MTGLLFVARPDCTDCITGRMANPVKINDRVIVQPSGAIGTVKFMGPTKFAKGRWIGIQLDKPGTGAHYPFLRDAGRSLLSDQSVPTLFAPVTIRRG